MNLQLDALRQAYRTGDTTPRQVLLQLREKAAALNPDYHLFIHLLSIDELEPYLAALDGRDLDSLPLYGVPFAIKDNIDLAGIPTTAACPAFAYVPQQSATIVEQLLALGAIPLGKTNLDQFATGLNGSRSPYGACPNSVLAEYPSGGSSSGSSLAVALGVASFALGTDTAGSGRVPAALNNLVGLKASKGLISTAGVLPACRTLDCVTTFTATAREASQLLALTAKHDPRDEYSRRNPAWNDGSASVRHGRSASACHGRKTWSFSAATRGRNCSQRPSNDSRPWVAKQSNWTCHRFWKRRVCSTTGLGSPSATASLVN